MRSWCVEDRGFRSFPFRGRYEGRGGGCFIVIFLSFVLGGILA